MYLQLLLCADVDVDVLEDLVASDVIVAAE